MSEFFSGITFPWQKVTPSDDASVRRSVLADGILSGCEISYIGSTLTMGAGLLIGCGRQFRHTAVQNFAVTGASSGYARLVIAIDTTKASTKDAFDQISTSIEYAAAVDGFTQLRQDNINEAGTVYQMQICVASLGAGGISGIVSQLGSAGKYVSKSSVVNNFTTTEEGFVADARTVNVLNDSKLSMELRWKNASPMSAFPAQNIDVDLSGGKYALIGYKPTNSNDVTTAWELAEIGMNIELSRTLPVDNYYKFTISTRDVWLYPTYVRFGNGKEVTYVSNPTDSANFLIPLEIYIIKGASAWNTH